MKKQIVFMLLGVFVTPFSTTNAMAQDQQDVRCVLGGSVVAGMVVHIDPATGRPTSRPMPEQAAEVASLQAASANRSTVGLVQEVGPTGGMRMNLRNRFRSPLVAVANPDGGLHVEHLSCQPATSVSDLSKSGDK